MKSLAVIRADDMLRVKTALYDLIRYAHLTFIGKARKLEPIFADNVLVQVMKSPLKSCCEAASIVPLEDDASVAIGRVKKIHPPAHIIIISPRHDIFYELVNFIDMLPEIELDHIERIFEDDMTETFEDNIARAPKDNVTMVGNANRQIKENSRKIENNKAKVLENNKAKVLENNKTKVLENNKTKVLGNNKIKTPEEKYDNQKFR